MLGSGSTLQAWVAELKRVAKRNTEIYEESCAPFSAGFLLCC